VLRLFSSVLPNTLFPKDSLNKTELSPQILVFLSEIHFEMPSICVPFLEDKLVLEQFHCASQTSYTMADLQNWREGRNAERIGDD